jgi:S1-C subfamily serine protease
VGSLPPIQSPYPSAPRPPAPEPEPEPPPKRRSRWVATALLPAAVAAAVAFGVARLTDDGVRTVTVVERQAQTAPATTTPDAPAGPRTDSGKAVESVQQIVRDASPGVVLVEQPKGLGSGFLIDAAGHILTNAHVVDTATTVTVTYADGTEQQAKVLAADPVIDIAVLDVGAPPASARPLPFGTSKSLTVGDPVVAIGNPLGYERTATTGIVSALKRQICSPNESSIPNAIQTDAAINQGNSGGPLLDRRGRVIGINSQIVSQGGGFEGIGFAVPIDAVHPVADGIIAGRKPEHAWIGIVGEPLTPAVAKQLGVPGTTGVALRKIDSRGPAGKAGLRGTSAARDEPPKGGDIIVGISGQPIRDFGDLSQEIGSRTVGDSVSVVVLRGGKRVTVTMKLQDRPADLGGTCQ